MRINTKSFFIATILLFAAGCTCSPSREGHGTAESASDKPQVTVNLAIWSNYITDELLEQFTKEHHVKVNVTNYAANEELLAKLLAGANGIDVAVPSDYMILAMTNLDLLQPLDHSKLPNEKDVGPEFLRKPFDPENKYTLPYSWTFSGIALNRRHFKGDVTGWADLLNKPELKGKISLLDDARETLGIALRTLGFSINTTSAEELAQAKKYLADRRLQVRAFNSEPMDSIMRGEVFAAHIYSCDALQAAKKTNGDVELFIPNEGGVMGLDNLVIPKTAAHVAEAHLLINFLLTKAVSKARVIATYASPILKGVRDELPAEFKDNALLFPEPKQMAKYENLRDLGDATVNYDKAWTDLKAGAG
jgi:spermidine/putrescine-binding protein